MSNTREYNLLYDPPEEIKPVQVRIPDIHGMKVVKVDPLDIKERCVSCPFSTACGVIDCVSCTQGILDGALNSKHGCSLLSGVHGNCKTLCVTNCSTVVGEEVICNIPAEENNSIQEEKTSADPNNLIGNIYKSQYFSADKRQYRRLMLIDSDGFCKINDYKTLEDAINDEHGEPYGYNYKSEVDKLVKNGTWEFIQNAADSTKLKVGDLYITDNKTNWRRINKIENGQVYYTFGHHTDFNNGSPNDISIGLFEKQVEQGILVKQSTTSSSPFKVGDKFESVLTGDENEIIGINGNDLKIKHHGPGGRTFITPIKKWQEGVYLHKHFQPLQ